MLVALGTANGYDAALRFACRQAVRRGQALQLVHVADPSTGPVDEDLVQAASRKAAQLTGGAVDIETATPIGPLVPTLVELSRSADTIVLQRRPSSRLRRMVAGLVSADVAAGAHTTMVMVPSTWRGSTTRDRRIVVGLDRTSDDPAVLVHAFAQADLMGAKLEIVHGWQMASPYDDAIVEQPVVEEWKQRYVASLNAAVRDLRLGSTTVSWSLEVVHDATESVLLAACARAGALVLGRGGVDVPLVGGLGPVTRALLRDAPCPVEVPCPAIDDRARRRPASAENAASLGQ